jgi:hypothetical protein
MAFELCSQCNALALTENGHSDEGHEVPIVDCKPCLQSFHDSGGKGTLKAEIAREERTRKENEAEGVRLE